MKEEKELYFISRLGADKRVFDNLAIQQKYKSKHIKWIKPENHNLKKYVQKLKLQIDETKQIILIGVSFGGIIAQELSKIIKTDKVIIISSLRNRNELPQLYKFLGWTKIQKIIPAKLLTIGNPFVYWLFGLKSEKEIETFKKILADSDPKFMKWAINEIVLWKGNATESDLIEIHGDKDKILYHPKRENVITIKIGGHLMIMNKAEEINSIIEQIIES